GRQARDAPVGAALGLQLAECLSAGGADEAAEGSAAACGGPLGQLAQQPAEPGTGEDGDLRLAVVGGDDGWLRRFRLGASRDGGRAGEEPTETIGPVVRPARPQRRRRADAGRDSGAFSAIIAGERGEAAREDDAGRIREVVRQDAQASGAQSPAAGAGREAGEKTGREGNAGEAVG